MIYQAIIGCRHNHKRRRIGNITLLVRSFDKLHGSLCGRIRNVRGNFRRDNGNMRVKFKENWYAPFGNVPAAYDERFFAAQINKQREKMFNQGSTCRCCRCTFPRYDPALHKNWQSRYQKRKSILQHHRQWLCWLVRYRQTRHSECSLRHCQW